MSFAILVSHIAQMDQSKSLAYQAMEELLKAQTTHCKLKRQFVLANTKEELNKRRKEFDRQEVHCTVYMCSANQAYCHELTNVMCRPTNKLYSII